MFKTIFVVLSLVQMSWASSCLAHKITVFGYVDQGLVKTESKFSGGRAAQHCQLSIITAAEPVAIGDTDEFGKLDFPAPESGIGFDFMVTCGDGHRGTWRIETDELQDVDTGHSHAKVPVVTLEKKQNANDLRILLQEELARELGPIKRQLAELKQDQVSVADVMGGLGYFLGLVGLASYMRFRKEGK